MERKTLEIQYLKYDVKDEMPQADALLLTKAEEMTRNSYAPYSVFHVGAAVRMERHAELIVFKRCSDRSIGSQNMRRTAGEVLSIYFERLDLISAVWNTGDSQNTSMCQTGESSGCCGFRTLGGTVVVCVFYFYFSVCRCSYARIVRDHPRCRCVAVELTVTVHAVLSITAGCTIENYGSVA